MYAEQNRDKPGDLSNEEGSRQQGRLTCRTFNTGGKVSASHIGANSSHHVEKRRPRRRQVLKPIPPGVPAGYFTSHRPEVARTTAEDCGTVGDCCAIFYKARKSVPAALPHPDNVRSGHQPRLREQPASGIRSNNLDIPVDPRVATHPHVAEWLRPSRR